MGAKHFALFLLTILFQLATSQLQAGPVTNTVLENYDIKTENGRQTIRIYFTLPVHYLSHFPMNSGTQLFIRIQPIPIGNLGNNIARRDLGNFGKIFSRRDTLVIKGTDETPLTSVQYDGEFSYTPYLIIDFEKEVRYRVYQGNDIRSVTIVITP